jgi:hypothetical protein
MGRTETGVLFASGSDTSQQAADSIAPSASALRQIVLEAIRSRRRDGATCDEIEASLAMKHQTASARITELKADQSVVDSGARRRTRSNRNAAVLVAAEFVVRKQ